MLDHRPRKANPVRGLLLKKSNERRSYDGLNSVKYELHGIVKYYLFTHIRIDVGLNLNKSLEEKVSFENEIREEKNIKKNISKSNSPNKYELFFALLMCLFILILSMVIGGTFLCHYLDFLGYNIF